MKMKKVFTSVIAIMAVALMATQTVSAGSVSSTGTTSGGTSGKTTISYVMACYPNYISSFDKTVLQMSAASGNLINFSYTSVKGTLKSGAVTTYSDSSSSNANSYKREIIHGSPYIMYSSTAAYKATNSAFGTWSKTVSCTF